MDKRTNQGYVITDSVHIGQAELVIGEKKTIYGTEYAVWRCKDGDSYFWGRYTDDRRVAEQDLVERAADLLDNGEESEDSAGTTENNLVVRPVTEEEQRFCYSSEKSGLIGYLRADFSSDGEGLFNDFFDCQPTLKTEAFRIDLNFVIESLMCDDQYECMLNSRRSLAGYCRNHPDSCIDNGRCYYGLRADTQDYVYLLRLHPGKGDYNLYCYCYVRRALEDCLQKGGTPD
ncbi:MAG: hypothetical protein LUE14_12335 [Clostridiales bacterium]|nr:hypothetical protein [Clostridiales bacterium]